jgi:hypothetical protein
MKSYSSPLFPNPILPTLNPLPASQQVAPKTEAQPQKDEVFEFGLIVALLKFIGG